jgi:hypothetical protein
MKKLRAATDTFTELAMIYAVLLLTSAVAAGSVQALAGLSMGNSNTLFKPDRPSVTPTPPHGSGLAHPSTA